MTFSDTKIVKKPLYTVNSLIFCFYGANVCSQARLAQSVERGTFNPEVKGSSPLSGEISRIISKSLVLP
jgi:hypothetical protein